MPDALLLCRAEHARHTSLVHCLRREDKAMPEINLDELDERTARVMLAMVAEPRDTTSRLVHELGGVRTVHVALGGEIPWFSPSASLEQWRQDIAPRLDFDGARRVLDESEKVGAQVLIPRTSEWPLDLRVLGPDQPIALWVRGLLSGPHPGLSTGVGLVGARACTAYGAAVAADLASGVVADGHTVVSGGAYGIDAAAHRAALLEGGRTIAVLPGGLGRPYPAGHRDLLEQVSASGALVIETVPGATPTRHRLEERGRLIAALTQSVVVVEAGVRSGALTTANLAMEFGRSVGAVPGPVTSPSSAGCHELIREHGASVVTGIADIRRELEKEGFGPAHQVEASDRPFSPSWLDAARDRAL